MPQHETVGMAYDFINNLIVKNPQNTILKTKASIFGAIRHELQHFYQNINIFRTEKVGDEAVDVYSRISAKQRQKCLDFEVKNQSIEQLKVNYDEKTIEYYKHLKDLLKNDQKAYEAELNGFEQIIFDSTRLQLQAFKELVIKEMGGQIKADTKLAKRSEKMLKEIQNDYWKTDGSAHAGKYGFDVRENDAFIAGQMAELKVLPQGEKFCYIKNLREKCEEVIKNIQQNANNKELTELTETVQDKVKQNNINSVKEYFDTMISYFYD